MLVEVLYTVILASPPYQQIELDLRAQVTEREGAWRRALQPNTRVSQSPWFLVSRLEDPV